MVRQAVFGAWLSFALVPVFGPFFAIQEKSTPPPAEIPLARLKPDAVLSTPLQAGAVASDDGVWIANRAAGTVIHVAAKDNALGKPASVGGEPCASLVVAFGTLWVPVCGAQTIARVDEKAQTITATVKASVADAEGGIASSVGSIWVVTDRAGVLSRFDPDTGLPVAEVYLPKGTAAVAASSDAVWVTSETAGRLSRVNPHNNEVVEPIAVGPRPRRLTVGEGAVWTLNGDGSISRVDPATNKVAATIKVGRDTAGGDIAAGAGSVWVSLPGVPIIRVDPRTNRAVQAFTGDGGGAILVAHGSLWVAAGPQTTWRLDPRLVETVRP